MSGRWVNDCEYRWLQKKPFSNEVLFTVQHSFSLIDVASTHMPAPSASSFYYLHNFQTVLDWVAARYGDLLDQTEQAFIQHFKQLPQASQALLVRMVMRRGDLFRASKLRYQEIGDTRLEVQALCAVGWVDAYPLLSLAQLAALLTKDELVAAFALKAGSAKKSELLARLQEAEMPPREFAAWCPASDDTVYALRIGARCDLLRLLFFGNLYQDWSEFVLADLGIYTYEKVAFPDSARAFQSREDVDLYLQLHAAREQFEQGATVADVLSALPAAPGNPWLLRRRDKLLFKLAQRDEQTGEWARALALYGECAYPGARIRCIRVLERSDQHAAALALAQQAEQTPESEAERQQLARMMPRLLRKLGQAKPAARQPTSLTRLDLALPKPDVPQAVEYLVRDHLATADAPVFYVENALINSLFGLLCWPAIFTPLPGAFFHPFQQAPADLLTPDFYARREAQFAQCLAQLASGTYRESILRTFREKQGIQSPFVYWGIVDEALLQLALDCLPATHLAHCFTRVLRDIGANRSGLPDLIQFFPAERRYRMLEVKGPGDRLQDNQVRWLDYCVTHEMPVCVCYVQWAEPTA